MSELQELTLAFRGLSDEEDDENASLDGDDLEEDDDELGLDDEDDEDVEDDGGFIE